jgi:hypothetical protein
MDIYSGNYMTDAGKIYFFVSLSASEFIPEIFKANTSKGTGFCTLPRTVQPRKAILLDTDGMEYIIEYPFLPGTAMWLEFWQQIRANPLIIASKGVGEIIKRIK